LAAAQILSFQKYAYDPADLQAKQGTLYLIRRAMVSGFWPLKFTADSVFLIMHTQSSLALLQPAHFLTRSYWPRSDTIVRERDLYSLK
tara:strand:- start:487 stop:750 length:264 start_codon:yes stop_codon:yes gene_type:complete